MRLEPVSDYTYRASGSATFESGSDDRDVTAAVLDEALEQHAALEIDVSGIEASNSIVLSLMLAWLRQARHLEKDLKFKNIGAPLSELIRFTGLDGILLNNGNPR